VKWCELKSNLIQRAFDVLSRELCFSLAFLANY
jgi:hypothetical protein